MVVHLAKGPKVEVRLLGIDTPEGVRRRGMLGPAGIQVRQERAPKGTWG